MYVKMKRAMAVAPDGLKVIQAKEGDVLDVPEDIAFMWIDRGDAETMQPPVTEKIEVRPEPKAERRPTRKAAR